MRYVKYFLAFLSCAITLSSCFSCMADQPKADKEEFSFGVDGGEEFVHITRLDNDKYSGKAQWTYIAPSPIEDAKDDEPSGIYEVSTLRDGRLEYYNDWLSFIVSTDYATIRVVVKKNTTGKPRRNFFIGKGTKGFSFSIKVKQAGQ